MGTAFLYYLLTLNKIKHHVIELTFRSRLKVIGNKEFKLALKYYRQ